MRDPPHLDPMPGTAVPPAADWSSLLAELDCWGEADRIAKLWWRDDDAAAATPELAALLRIADGTPIALAVIPALATADLASVLRDLPLVTVLQHGWRHANRAVGDKKSEYPSGLPASVAAAEIATGRDRLAALFGIRTLLIFVPPWNRIAPELLAVLVDKGIVAVSTFASARQPEWSPCLPLGLARLDTHVDLTDWKGGKRFIGAAVALGLLTFWLRHVRLGNRSPDCAIGILTHHMVMDRETAAFASQLVELVAGHPAGRWVDIAEMLR